MLKVALTGGIGTGKSELLKLFKRKGVPALSADELVKSFQSPGNVLWQQIRKKWGGEFFTGNGELDRRKVAEKLLSCGKFKKEIEILTHPVIKSEIKKIFTVWERENQPLAAVEVSLLFQAGWEDLFDFIIMTVAPENIQLKRVMEKRNVSREKARRWIEIQTLDKEYEKKSDIVLDTSVSLRETEKKVEEIIEKLKEEKR